MVAEKNIVKEVYEDKSLFRLVPFNSLGGTGLLPAFKPEKIYTKKDKKLLECYLAIYDGKLSSGSFNCLVNSELI